MKNKKLIVILGIIALALIVGLVWVKRQKQSTSNIVIGAVLPMTGDASKYGKWTSQGAQLAIDEINSQGGINGHNLMLKVQDSQTNPKSGTSAFQQLLVTDHPLVVLTTLTSVSRALIPLAQSNRVVLFANATLPGLTEGHNLVFRNVANLASDIPAAVRYVTEKMNRIRVAIIWRNDEFGVWGSKKFSELYVASSGQVIASEGYDPKTEDFRTIITKISAGKPELVYLLGYSEVGKIARQATELGQKWKFLGINTTGDPEAIRLASGALEGAVYTEPAASLSSTAPHISAFRQKYKERFGEEPEVWAATFYDAVKIVSNCLQGKEVSADNLRQELLQVRDYLGVSGTTTFLPNGDVDKPVEYKIIQNDRGVPLPQTQAEAASTSTSPKAAAAGQSR